MTFDSPIRYDVGCRDCAMERAKDGDYVDYEVYKKLLGQSIDKEKLIALIEEYVNDSSHHYYIEDQGTTSKQVDDALQCMERSKAALYDYIHNI